MILTQEYLNSIFTYDKLTGKLFRKPRPESSFKNTRGYKTFNSRFLNKEVGHKYVTDGVTYRSTMIEGKRYLCHRLVWMMEYGNFPERFIDHINGVGDDNRLENLREVTSSGNQKNLKKFVTNSSGITGVTFEKARGRWRAFISDKNKAISLGIYKDKFEAICARKSAELLYNYHPNHGSERAL